MRARLFVTMVLAAAAACGSSAPTLSLPSWLESTARWRNAQPSLSTSRLDAAISRHARAYKDLHGAARYREFALPPARTFADAAAAVEGALAAARREATRQDVPATLDDEREVRWKTRQGTVVMVLLSRVDPARADAPAFVLLFEPQ